MWEELRLILTVDIPDIWVNIGIAVTLWVSIMFAKYGGRFFDDL